MYLRLREVKSGTDINLTDCAVFSSEYLDLERRDKLLMSIASGKGALSMDN